MLQSKTFRYQAEVFQFMDQALPYLIGGRGDATDGV